MTARDYLSTLMACVEGDKVKAERYLDAYRDEVLREAAEQLREYSWEFGYMPNQQVVLQVAGWLDPTTDQSPRSPELDALPGAPKNYNGPLTLDANRINELIADTLRSAAAKIVKIYEVWEDGGFGRTGDPYSRAWQADYVAWKAAEARARKPLTWHEVVHVRPRDIAPGPAVWNGYAWGDPRWGPEDATAWVEEVEVHP